MTFLTAVAVSTLLPRRASNTRKLDNYLLVFYTCFSVETGDVLAGWLAALVAGLEAG